MKKLSKLTLNGWQSWSSVSAPRYKLPLRYFSPFKQNKSTLLIPQKPISRQNHLRGWSSWPAFGTNINEEIILNQAKEAKKLNLEYILIDDGWTTWGDWLTPDPKKFPTGLKSLIQKINQIGLRVGIWWAPLLAKQSSKLFSEHPNWFVTNFEATKVSPLDIFIKDKRRLLNLEQPEVQKYLNKVLEFFKSAKVELIKSDFLYANHFNPAHTSSEIPDLLLHNLLSSITKFKFYSIACGCPLKPAIGVVNAMRISDDINYPLLNNLWPINKFIVTSRLKQLIKNLKSRKDTNQIWILDLDSLITDSSMGISKKQALTLAKLIADNNGLLFLGDNLQKPSKRRNFALSVFS